MYERISTLAAVVGWSKTGIAMPGPPRSRAIILTTVAMWARRIADHRYPGERHFPDRGGY